MQNGAAEPEKNRHPGQEPRIRLVDSSQGPLNSRFRSNVTELPFFASPVTFGPRGVDRAGRPR